jgi:hypothetical protein
MGELSISTRATKARNGVSLEAMAARQPEARHRAIAARPDELVAPHMVLRDVRKGLPQAQRQVAAPRRSPLALARTACVEEAST